MIAKPYPDMKTSPNQHRIFFALWPDAATRAALLRLQPALDGRHTAVQNLHLTMAFLGMQAAEVVPQLCAILAALPGRAITLDLDKLGYFKREQIAWAGMRVVPQALLQLQDALMQSLRAAHIGVEHEPGFAPHLTPHLTLSRRASAPALASFKTIGWQASELALVESWMKSGTRGDYLVRATRQLA